MTEFKVGDHIRPIGNGQRAVKRVVDYIDPVVVDYTVTYNDGQTEKFSVARDVFNQRYELEVQS